jgi:signal peptidase II
MDQRRTAKAVMLCVVATTLLTITDLGSKAWAEAALSLERTAAPPPVCARDQLGRAGMQRLRGEIIELVPGYLELRYAENCGAAFGMLTDAPRWLRAGIFLGTGVVFVVILGAMFVRGSGGPLFAWSVPMVVSGALGNMVDRARAGYVVDFIHFHVHDSFHYPTFNVADITITIGLGLFLLDGLRRPAATAGEPQPGPAAPQTPGA